MTRFAIVGCVLAVAASIAPPTALAALDLRIGPNRGADAVDAAVAPGSGEHFFDLTFTETPPTENEFLYAYDVLFEAAQTGIRLLRAERPDNFVLTAPDATFVQSEADAGHILAAAQDGTSLGVDVVTGPKAARVYYAVDPGTTPGLYRITLNPVGTTFVSGDPNRQGYFPVVDITDPGVVLVTPEPSGLALLAVAGLLALRRRAGA